MFNKRLFLTKRRRRSNRFLNLKTLVESLNPVSGLSMSRRLSSSVDNLIRVRLGSDNSELDIGFKNNVLDAQSLIDFGGYNLLGYTEDLANNSFYVKSRSNVSESGTFNGNKVFKIIEATNDNDEHYLQVTLNNAGNNTFYTLSAVVKADTRNKIRLAIFMPGIKVGAQDYNLANGTIVDTNDVDNVASGIEFLEDGFYKIYLTVKSEVNTLVRPQIVILNDTYQQTYVGNEKGFFISSLQMEISNQPPRAYQPRLAGGASDCFVAKWYDQSGNGNHATQTVATNQPKIYDVLTGDITRENGKPAMVFDGVNDNLEIPNVAGRSNIDVYFVNRHDTSNTLNNNTTKYIYPSIGSGAGGIYGFVSQQNSTLISITSNYGNPNLYKNNTLLTVITRDDVYNTLGQTQNIVNHQGADVSTWPSFNFGNFVNSQFNFEGTLQEIVVFDNNLTPDNRQKLHDDINDHYDIF